MRICARGLVIVVCVAAGLGRGTAQDTPALTTRPAPAAAPSYADDPKFQKALEEAKDKKPMPSDEHLARWKHASKLAKNECVECLHQVLFWQMKLQQWKDAVGTATDLEKAATEKKEKYYAESERGFALMHANNDKPKPDQLKDAEASLHAALEIAPNGKTVLFSEGRALAMLNRDEEAKAVFQRYVDSAPYSDPYRTRAEHFIENPRLASMQMAPAFTLTTSEGEQISLDDMGGKVVFLDFWATWCGPCKESIPAIKKIAKDFAGQPLVVVSISIDRDDIAWKNFIEKNEMTWPQYRDANGQLALAYGAQSIPRTFMIDTDGVLQAVNVGWGSSSDPEADVRRLVKKAVDAEKKRAKETDKASGTD